MELQLNTRSADRWSADRFALHCIGTALVQAGAWSGYLCAKMALGFAWRASSIRCGGLRKPSGLEKGSRTRAECSLSRRYDARVRQCHTPQPNDPGRNVHSDEYRGGARAEKQ